VNRQPRTVGRNLKDEIEERNDAARAPLLLKLPLLPQISSGYPVHNEMNWNADIAARGAGRFLSIRLFLTPRESGVVIDRRTGNRDVIRFDGENHISKTLDWNHQKARAKQRR
jgi:hypothetical protein